MDVCTKNRHGHCDITVAHYWEYCVMVFTKTSLANGGKSFDQGRGGRLDAQGGGYTGIEKIT